MKKKTLISLILLTLVSVSSFSFFLENPTNLIVSGNSVYFEMKTIDQDGILLKVGWQKREGVLNGELGYQTNTDFSTGFVNYKLSSLKDNFGLNIKFQVMPADKFKLSLDAAGRIFLSNYTLVDFGALDIVLFSTEIPINKIPEFFGGITSVLTKNVGISVYVNSIEENKLRLSLGTSLYNLFFNSLTFAYSPVFRISDDRTQIDIFNFIDGTLTFTASNFRFALSGFYNLSETLDTDNYLKNVYGIKLALGVDM
ncbi:MAG: hypothetical protein ACP5KD_06145 [Fervidobacterium sp.]